MVSTYVDPLEQTLRLAMDLGRTGRLEEAEDLLDAILSRYPRHADALQLSGMVARMQGSNEVAIDRFRKAITFGAGANVQNNLGNTLLAVGQQREAIAAYKAATAAAPKYLDSWINLGIALLETGEAEEAESALSTAVNLDPGSAKACAAMGRALRAQGKLHEAVEALQTAIRLRPGHVATMHNLAVALRLTSQPARALSLLEQCISTQPENPTIRYNMGHCLQDLGRNADAAAAYRAVIASEPANREAHASLSRLLWQTGSRGDYLQSYIDAIERNTPNAGLYADLAHRLILDGQSLKAVTLLSDAVKRAIDDAEIRHRLGQALWGLGRTNEAIDQFAAASRDDPGNAAIAREHARSLIILSRYDEALALIEPVLARHPDDQQAIAYRNLCLHLTGDSRAPAPDEAERLVAVLPLTPPPGEGDVATFNLRLSAALDRLHTMSTHPLEQTLRGGTQTVGELFDQPIAEITTLRAMIEAAVQSYIEALPDDADHPFLRRKTGKFGVSGSWSVRLCNEGHHMNHIHPEGWISSCYYVDLPPAIDMQPGNQGWLKIGETALGLGERERIERLIRPQTGTLVLFPSYFYHGTIRFTDDHPRTTVAFDIVPAPN